MSVKKIKNYINGQWVESSSSRVLDVENPGTGEILAQVPLSTRQEVHKAVKAAKDAFSQWKEVTPTERVGYLFKLKFLLEKNKEELARIITQDHGKVIDDARGEMKRAIENVEMAIGTPSLMQGKILQNVSKGIDEYFIRVPLGVFAAIAPFNFPAMIPFWFLPYAVATGNTYILKPSEQVPLTMKRVFELIDEVGFPPGVLNLVNGDKVAVDALIENEDIVGISSITSTPVAEYIYHKAAEHNKRVQCGGGAKNSLVVMPDADLEKTVPNIIDSVYGNTGQRCLAGANVIAVGEVYAELKKRLVESAKKIKVGYGLDKSITMGPVISQKAKEKILSYIDKGLEQGAKLILDRRSIRVKEYPQGHYLGPCIFDEVKQEMVIACDEIFGPVMTIIKAKDLDEAIEIINRGPHGNAAMIYTTNGKSAREFSLRVDCGNIGIQIGLPAPVAYFPFVGMKKSFFGDLHGQGQDAVDFFTHKKVIISRWW
ncbi:CoA-acylating methylmalonate-semialdehyde dehydrogenase [Patescibacteria group bacterium AH-259-L05]|nr:CoA-acylating methylmalonate-semialdehyde dehydrogenase [Patescibacteria group bacterium AH-259-L05]